MHGSAAHAALGLLIAGLALAALAAQRRPSLQLEAAVAAQASAERGAAVGSGATRHGTAASASPATVRALRDGARVELNQALPEDLILLPGIGPKLAQRIVEERARRGGFATVDELLVVRGMGPKTLAKLRELIEVKPRPGPLRTDRSGTTASGPP